MPVEVRRLIFTPDELKAVIQDYVNTSRAVTVRGTVLDLTVTREKPVTLTLLLQSREGRQVGLDLDEAHAAAAIISYCMKHKIPLAKDASKSVKRVQTGIALDMSVSTPLKAAKG